ncbi:2OG-Fe(II) oxygenase [Pigmentiphaga litoralis]|uniref:2OG-Fe(II) oxygenase n=1 Tax=Pigmentiphaga litoralis TaxID=516702 RepID=UPI00167BB2C8|nr:2OG-Fe(II) oxygenase [Pigmentiphaga litoralis]GGX05456.1 2OG-Fe(II) oxygenase [Pigmentiphaga litoralis]
MPSVYPQAAGAVVAAPLALADVGLAPVPVPTPECLSAHTLEHLSVHSWAEQSLFLLPSLTDALSAECRRRADDGSFRLAGVGTGSGRVTLPTLRGDRILWLERGLSDACDAYLGVMEGVRQALNGQFFLGLRDYETHFACYAPGAGYVRHLDRFRDSDARVVSAVLYLNEAWTATDGGALRLHPPGGLPVEVQPDAGRLVLFMSAEMPHEVLPSTRDRLSLAGWFRQAPK